MIPDKPGFWRYIGEDKNEYIAMVAMFDGSQDFLLAKIEAWPDMTWLLDSYHFVEWLGPVEPYRDTATEDDSILVRDLLDLESDLSQGAYDQQEDPKIVRRAIDWILRHFGQRIDGWTVVPIQETTTRDIYADVLEFHRAFAPSIIGDSPRFIDFDTYDVKFIEEEFAELKRSIADRDMVGVADALGDIQYVTNRAAIIRGIDLRPVHAEIHRSNMTKTGSEVRGDFKVMKGPNYIPPDLAKVLREQGWQG